MDSDERDLLLGTARKLAEKYDEHYWRQCAREERFVDELWMDMAHAGILGLGIPEADGGFGGGMTELCMVTEEMAKISRVPVMLIVTGLARIPILKYGTPLQRRQLVSETVSGRIRLCFAITEPDAGTNTFRIQTLAMRQPDGSYLLNGQKVFISDVKDSHYVLVVTRTTPLNQVADRRNGISLMMVDLTSPGVHYRELNIDVKKPERQFSLFFDNVRLPSEALLGDEGQGFRYLFDALNPERQLAAASALGTGYRALSKGVAYAKERTIFGNQPIGSYQALQHPMAMARARLDAARLMLYRAAALFDEGKSSGTESNMAKLLASEAGFEACDIALQAHGGYGFDRDHEIFGLWEGSRVSKTAPINNHMILNYIAEHVLGLPKSYAV